MKFLTELAKSFFLIVILSAIFCFFYPVGIFFISQTFFHNKANGSLIKKDDKIIGSKLLGQKFTSAYYFHGRPSISDYDGINSSASNFGPTSKELLNNLKKNANKYRTINNIKSDTLIPIDAVTFSASSLDPHITYQNALEQSNRVAKSRNISIDKILSIIEKNKESKTLLSRDRINVLKLNLALDKEFPLKG
jgi:potassium-transporting ATPase KdpC subunit